MKVSLVVATGVHQGKVIPIAGSQFLIGRDPECQLRPASQAVSKKHCAVVIRDGAVYLKDYGSTNGTVLNDGIVQDTERQLKNNDLVKIGPLDFTVRIEPSAAKDDGTPLPELNPDAAAAIAAVKAVAAPKVPQRDATPAPKAPAKSVATPNPAARPAPAPKPTPKPDATPPAVVGAGASTDDEHDRLAAMLLGLEDGEVPGGSTVVDVPLPDLTAVTPAVADQTAQDKTNDRIDKAGKASQQKGEDTSSAASEILRRYMRRPK